MDGFIAMLLQRIQQQGREAEVALMEISQVGGSVHTSKVEHEVCLGAEDVQFRLRVVDIVFENVLNMDVRARAVLAVTDVLQVVDQSRADHALRAGDQYIHNSNFLYCILSPI